MEKIDWGENVANVGDADYSRIEPGAYVARIVAATDYAENKYFELIYDIAEGPHTGYYSNTWGAEHPKAHRIVMSYKPQALDMLKGRMNAFDASNPGFDSRAAYNAGRLDYFVNRLIGVNLREYEYLRNDGTVGVGMMCDQVATAQAVRDGLVKTRPIKKLNGGTKGSTTTSIDKDVAASIDVPFA